MLALFAKSRPEDKPSEAQDPDNTPLDDTESSIIKSLIYQLKVGMDLSKITFPTFVLEPRSMLERITDFMSHPDLIFGSEDCINPEERFIRVLQFYLSGWHIRPKGVKKPYNPVLGEFFRCWYEYANHTKGYYVAEQVSHHPPISAFVYISPANRLCIVGELRPKSTFVWNGVEMSMEGENRITLMGKPDDQEYVVTMPNMRASGLLFGTLAYELGGQCVVENKPNQLRCPLDFKTRGFFSSSGPTHTVSGRVYRAKTEIGTVSGRWSQQMSYKSTGSPSCSNDNGQLDRVLFDVPKDGKQVATKLLHPEECQEPYESRRLWRELTSALDARDMVAATAAKTAVEDAQRSLRQDREAKGENFVPRFFELREGRWQPKLVIHSNIDPSSVEQWIWPSSPVADITTQ